MALFKKRKQEIQALRDSGMTVVVAGKHVSGLPLAENTSCLVRSFPNKLEIKAGDITIDLDKSKITDIQLVSDRDVQKKKVSSIGGAVAGGVVFGPLGAIIGGRAKTKKVTTINYYLIITYQDKNDNLVNIGFDLAGYAGGVDKLIKEFKSAYGSQDTHIEL